MTGGEAPSVVPPRQTRHLLNAEFAALEPRFAARGHRKDRLVGLALSGGGIRSATFGLGVMQALVREKLLPGVKGGFLAKVDYLSTVSGGGYIGSAMSWLLNQKGRRGSFPFGPTTSRFPFATHPADGSTASRKRRNKIVDFLRRNRNYLFPGSGIGPLSLATVMFRGLLGNIFLYALAPVLGFFFLNALAIELCEFWPVRIFPPATLPEFINPFNRYRFAPWVFLAAGLFLVAALLLGLLAWLLVALAKIKLFPWGRDGLVAYLGRRFYDRNAPEALFFMAALLALGGIPYANLLVRGELMNTFKDSGAGGILALAGGLSTLASRWGKGFKMLSKLPLDWMARLGCLALFYGMALLYYALALRLPGWIPGFPELKQRVGDFPAALTITLAGLSVNIILAFLRDVNQSSPHRYYRDRLMETFLPDLPQVLLPRRVNPPSLAADRTPLSAMAANTEAPYHLVCCHAVLSGSKDKTLRSRGGDSFILSPLYSGSRATGWRSTKTYMADRMTLATAMAISGAALNPGAGVSGEGMTRDPMMALALAYFNLRLGFSGPNPSNRVQTWAENYLSDGWNHASPWAFREDSYSVTLSDGGHFENLGLYELLRRRVRLIVAVDGAEDSKFGFADLANALEKARVDFGVTVGLKGVEDLIPRKGEDPELGLLLAKRGFAVGVINYPATPKEAAVEGRILYLKLTLVEALPQDLYGYKRAHDSFPAEPTTDQFFDEKQFEAYRELGYQLAKNMMLDGGAGSILKAGALGKEFR